MSTEAATLERRPRPHTYNDYSRERKAEVIALVKANSGNILQTAEETGIRETTIQYWLDNEDRYHEFREQKQADLANRFETVAHDWLSIAERKAPNAPFNHLMTGVGIAVDKAMLLRGQSGEQPLTIQDLERAAKVNQLINQITAKALPPGPATDTKEVDGTFEPVAE